MPQKPTHELTRKEMKGPDHFQLALAEAAEWAGKRQKVILAGVVALVAVLAAVVGISSYRESSRAAAGAQLSRALEIAGGDVSSIPLPNAGRPIYKTAADKNAALLAAAQAVRKEHGGSRAAVTAALLEGDAQLGMGKWDEAAAAYRAFLDGAGEGDSLRFSASDGLARALEGKGDLDGAAKAYEAAGGLELFRDRAALERARLLAKAGKVEEARKSLDAISKTSPLAGEVQERLARLGAK